MRKSGRAESGTRTMKQTFVVAMLGWFVLACSLLPLIADEAKAFNDDATAVAPIPVAHRGLLRHRRDCTWLPGFNDILHRQHAATRSDCRCQSGLGITHERAHLHNADSKRPKSSRNNSVTAERDALTFWLTIVKPRPLVAVLLYRTSKPTACRRTPSRRQVVGLGLGLRAKVHNSNLYTEIGMVIS